MRRLGILALTFALSSSVVATARLHQIRLQLQGDLSETRRQYQETALERDTLEEQAGVLRDSVDGLTRQLDEQKAAYAALQQQKASVRPVAASPDTSSVKAAVQDALTSLGQAGSFDAVDHIFNGESSWDPTAVNGEGCYGLGQSCPFGSQMAKECPQWATDIACQVKHFAGYAERRYGGWEQALAHWKVHRNW